MVTLFGVFWDEVLAGWMAGEIRAPVGVMGGIDVTCVFVVSCVVCFVYVCVCVLCCSICFFN